MGQATSFTVPFIGGTILYVKPPEDEEGDDGFTTLLETDDRYVVIAKKNKNDPASLRLLNDPEPRHARYMEVIMERLRQKPVTCKLCRNMINLSTPLIARIILERHHLNISEVQCCANGDRHAARIGKVTISLVTVPVPPHHHHHHHH